MAEFDFKAVTLDGNVFDQYSHPVPYMQSGAFPHPKKTWAFFWAKVRGMLAGFVARRTASSNIAGFTKAGLHEEAAAIYMRVQEAQAQMQPDLVRDVSVFVCGGRGCGRKRREQVHAMQHWPGLESALGHAVWMFGAAATVCLLHCAAIVAGGALSTSILCVPLCPPPTHIHPPTPRL